MMQTTVMRMASMIDNVLDFARGRLGGGITLERDAARPLEPVLAQVVDELRLASPGRVIEADFAIERPVNCDRIRIGQLLSNLLGNALTHGAADKPVVVHAETRDGSFELWVANAANPFRRRRSSSCSNHSSAERRASGQGLGLASTSHPRSQGPRGTLTLASGPAETRFTSPCLSDSRTQRGDEGRGVLKSTTRERMLEEETQHFTRRVRPSRIGIGAGGTAS
jgi:sigma-B regulation protein RsbU (phosphoserine phosphatase)